MNLIIDPLICPSPSVSPKLLKTQSSIQLALILECIWKIRNQVVHNEAKVNLLVEVKNLEVRIGEHLQILGPARETDTLSPQLWKAPPYPFVKFNIDADAVVCITSATIAVVARCFDGSIFQCWTKKLSTTDPCIAEATALPWVLEIARALWIDDIVIEGDAKICIDAFHYFHNTATFTPWKIQSLISNAQNLSLNFSSVTVCWVRREANMVTHSLAKVAAS